MRWEAYNLLQFRRNFSNDLLVSLFARPTPFTSGARPHSRQVPVRSEHAIATGPWTDHASQVLSGSISFPSVSTTLLSDAILVESWEPGVPVSEIYSEPPAALGEEALGARGSTGSRDRLQTLTMLERQNMADAVRMPRVCYATAHERPSVMRARRLHG